LRILIALSVNSGLLASVSHVLLATEKCNAVLVLRVTPLCGGAPFAARVVGIGMGNPVSSLLLPEVMKHLPPWVPVYFRNMSSICPPVHHITLPGWVQLWCWRGGPLVESGGGACVGLAAGGLKSLVGGLPVAYLL
jgi:hypothetical protein